METQTYLYGDIWELVEVGGVVNGADLDGDGGGPLPDVVPVHPLEPGHALDVLQTLDPLLPLVTEPAQQSRYHQMHSVAILMHRIQFYCQSAAQFTLK